MPSDISYKINEEGQKYRFNYRVAAIIEGEGKILINKFLHEGHSFLPGGRVQLGETAQDAVLRELEEELGIKASIESLSFLVENFFTYNGETFHEVSLYFKIDRSGLDLPADKEIRENCQFFWRTTDDMDDVNLQPVFLRKELGNLPEITKHIVNIDDGFRKEES